MNADATLRSAGDFSSKTKVVSVGLSCWNLDVMRTALKILSNRARTFDAREHCSLTCSPLKQTKARNPCAHQSQIAGTKEMLKCFYPGLDYVLS